MQQILHGTVHQVQPDMAEALRCSPAMFELWQSLTPLGRNEFICWVDDAKLAKTRARRIARTCEELAEGKRRPCCWPGCVHRDDKPPSRWQREMAAKQAQAR